MRVGSDEHEEVHQGSEQKGRMHRFEVGREPYDGVNEACGQTNHVSGES